MTNGEISSSHGGEYDVQSCLLGYTAIIRDESSLMMAIRTSETSVDNHFTRQYTPEDNSEQQMTNGCAAKKLSAIRRVPKWKMLGITGV
jgi:hypothetical protein